MKMKEDLYNDNTIPIADLAHNVEWLSETNPTGQGICRSNHHAGDLLTNHIQQCDQNVL